MNPVDIQRGETGTLPPRSSHLNLNEIRHSDFERAHMNQMDQILHCDIYKRTSHISLVYNRVQGIRNDRHVQTYICH